MIFFEETKLLLTTYFDEVLKVIVTCLESNGYICEYGLVDVQHHGGVSQHRERCILAAVHQTELDDDLMQSGFSLLPEKLPFDSPPAHCLLKRRRGDGSEATNDRIKKIIKNTRSDCRNQNIKDSTAVFVDVLSSERFSSRNVEQCPSITARRGEDRGFWLLHKDIF